MLPPFGIRHKSWLRGLLPRVIPQILWLAHWIRLRKWTVRIYLWSELGIRLMLHFVALLSLTIPANILELNVLLINIGMSSEMIGCWHLCCQSNCRWCSGGHLHLRTKWHPISLIPQFRGLVSFLNWQDISNVEDVRFVRWMDVGVEERWILSPRVHASPTPSSPSSHALPREWFTCCSAHVACSMWAVLKDPCRWD